MLRAMVEPDRLLEEYQAHLDDNGGILLDSIPHLLELMNSVNGKLVPKCISLCIISCSPSDVQFKLCKAGAWDILLKWLQEALKEENYSFLIELLNLYLKLPVRLEQLTQNVCPKLINSLTKRCDHEVVKSIAMEIVKKWKAVISADSRRVVDQPDLKRKKTDMDLKPDPTSGESLKDEKKRRRTVKMPPTTMRTAGIEDAPETQPKSRSEVFAKKSKVESESKPQELPIESFHQKITVTPTEPKKVAEIHESSSFINALTTITSPVVRKKRKMPPVKLDTIVVNEPSSVGTNQICPIDPQSTIDSQGNDQSEHDSSLEASPSPVSVGAGAKKSSLISIASAFCSDGKPKKRVSWADEDKLQTFHYFELDESERVNVNRISADEIRRKELSMERQLFKRSADDFTISTEKWHAPLPLERIFLVEPGFKSVERQVQTERERYVLQAIYFTRESIPSSPEEPDVEVVEPSIPVDIPLEDLTLLEPVTDSGQFASEKLLVVKDTQMSLNPEVADLVKSLAANLTGATPTSAPSVAPSVPPATSEVDFPVSNPQPSVRPPVTNALHSIASAPRNEQDLQHELWDVLEENYPDIKLHELSAERIRDLLEPLRDQLVARGIFQIPTSDVYAAPPLRPLLRYSHPPTSHPNYHGPPPQAVGPGAHPDFRPKHTVPRPGPPMHNGFRGGMPASAHGPPRFLPSGPPPPFVRGPGPMRGPPPSAPQGPPPGHRPPPYMRGTGRGRGAQLCKFFQQGNCRNGAACGFLHSKR